MATPPRGGRLDLLLGALAPVLAAVSSAVALCCLVTVPDVVRAGPTLTSVEPALPAWAGLAAAIAVAAAAVALLSCSRTGPGPVLSVGAVAAVSGRLLARSLEDGTEVVLALLILGTAVGALAVGGLCMLEEVPARWVRPTYIGWLVPLAGGWGVLALVALRGRSAGEAQIGVPVGDWVVGLACGLLVCWGIVAVVREPERTPNPSGAGWENAWAGLGALVAAASTVVMLVGFQPQLAASWVRPVVLLLTVSALAGLLACAGLMPLRGLRPAYLAVAMALLSGPGCLQVIVLVAAPPSQPPSAWTAVGLAAAAAAGGVLGWRRPEASLSGGLAVMGLAAAGGWALPSSAVWAAVAAAPLASGMAGSVTAGLRLAAGSRMAVRFVTMGGLVAVLFGLLSAAPLAWSLGAPLGDSESAVRDGGRVLLGLTFALVVMGAAGVGVLLRRAARAAPPALREGPSQARSRAGRHP